MGGLEGAQISPFSVFWNFKKQQLFVERPVLEGVFWTRNNSINGMKLQKKAFIWGIYKRLLQLKRGKKSYSKKGREITPCHNQTDYSLKKIQAI